MILLVDVGNSNIVFGFSDGLEIKNTFRFKSVKDITTDEYHFICYTCNYKCFK